MKKLPLFSKAAIVGLLLCAAGLVWLLCHPDPAIWRLRTTFHVGTSASPAAVIEGTPNLQGAIERYSAVVTLISTPVFRDAVAGASKFEAASAGLSKRLVFDTLRAHALNDYDIEIDFAAGSAADCRAAYQTIAERIEQRHAVLSEQNAKILQLAIDDYRERAAQLAKWEDARLGPDYKPSADRDNAKTGLGLIWNETREHVRQLEEVKSVMTPTTFPPEQEVYVDGPLTNNTVRLSALAGLGVILAVLALAWGLNTRASRGRNTDT